MMVKEINKISFIYLIYFLIEIKSHGRKQNLCRKLNQSRKYERFNEVESMICLFNFLHLHNAKIAPITVNQWLLVNSSYELIKRNEV